LCFVETKTVYAAWFACLLIPCTLIETLQSAVPNIKNNCQIKFDGCTPGFQGCLENILELAFHIWTSLRIDDKTQINIRIGATAACEPARPVQDYT